MKTVSDLKTPKMPDIMVVDLEENEPAEVQVVATGRASVVDALRASFAAKPSKYVFDCATKTEEDWNQLYPPMVKEIASLPGSNLPEWHYSWNYCTNCDNVLRSCQNNPYGFYGAIGKAQMEAQERHRLERLATAATPQIVQEVTDEVTGEVTTVTVPATVRKARGSYKQKVDSDSQKAVKDMYHADGATIAEVAEHFMVAPAAIREFLLAEGVLRKKGQSAKPREMVTTVTGTTPTVVRAGFGRKRTTLMVTPELAQEVKEMIDKKIGGGIVAIAKLKNVNPNELSLAVKTLGGVVKRGKQKAV